MKRFRLHYFAIAVLAALYVAATVRFAVISYARNDTGDAGIKRVQLAHWQLEPGFRQGLQWAIDRYNELPHVREARVFVEQLPVTDRVYNQFMNVHLISGTAPDIAQKGFTALIRGNAAAKFYAPLDDYISQPNPYNEPEWLPEDIDPALADYLAAAEWRNTFFDGMLGGYDVHLNAFYAIPIASFGTVRYYYNMDLMRSLKDSLLAAAGSDVRPDWLSKALAEIRPARPELGPDWMDWLRSDRGPDTLGQLFLLFAAVQPYAESVGDDRLVAVAASSNENHDLARTYQGAWFSPFGRELDLDGDTTLQGYEYYGAYEAGLWSYDTPIIRDFYHFSRTLASYYPTGFIGLDREQAQRRFVLGDALVLCSGGWDAGSILSGVAARDRPEDRFEVKIQPHPLPGPGERWTEYLPAYASEAQNRSGVPLAINKTSPEFEWALDFLRFVSSYKINEGFTARAGWLPAVIGAEPVPQLAAFQPIADGIAGYDVFLNMQHNAIPSIRNAHTGQLKILQSGEIDYPTFAANMRTTLDDPRHGTRRQWVRNRVQSIDEENRNQATLSVEQIRAGEMGEPEAEQRYRSAFLRILTHGDGAAVEATWDLYHPDESFPSDQP